MCCERQLKKCGAKTRSGEPCKSWALANGRCRMHGGKSTGPKTEEGRRKIGRIRTTHGKRARLRDKRKHLLKHIKLWQCMYGRDAPSFIVQEFWQKLKAMRWEEFLVKRRQFLKYYQKHINYRKLKKIRKGINNVTKPKTNDQEDFT